MLERVKSTELPTSKKLMEKILLNFLLFVCGIAIFGCSSEYQDFTLGQNDDAYKACIAIESFNSGVEILAFCRNNTAQDVVLRYELKAKKTGNAGRAETSQTGSVEITSGKKKCLSRLGLSVSANDRYQIELKLYKDEKLVAEDFVSYPKEL